MQKLSYTHVLSMLRKSHHGFTLHVGCPLEGTLLPEEKSESEGEINVTSEKCLS